MPAPVVASYAVDATLAARAVRSFTAAFGTFKARAAGYGGERAVWSAKFMREWDAFIGRLGMAGDRAILALDKEVRGLFLAIAARTPVRTGKARRGWRLSVSGGGDAFEWDILNEVPYVIYLEFGWSKQAPQGMVRISVSEFLSRIKRRRFFLEKYGVNVPDAIVAD